MLFRSFNKKLVRAHTTPVVVELKASKAGYVADCDARILGEVVRELGGGRLTKESVLNYEVGVDAIAKPGEPIRKGDVLARIHAADISQVDNARARLNTAFKISAEPPAASLLIEDIIEASQ